MTSQAELTPTIHVKGVETTPEKWLKFVAELYEISKRAFDDPNYIAKNIESQLFESINSRDRGLIDYEKLKNERRHEIGFKLREIRQW